jgi:hypothetical protein
MPLSEYEAHDHLKRTLAASEWDVIREYDVLRTATPRRMSAGESTCG